MSIEAEIARLTGGATGRHADHIAYAVRESCHTWDALMREDPELTKLDVRIALAAKVMVGAHPSSPVYAQAQREDWLYRAERRALLLKREAHRAGERAAV